MRYWKHQNGPGTLCVPVWVICVTPCVLFMCSFMCRCACDCVAWYVLFVCPWLRYVCGVVCNICVSLCVIFVWPCVLIICVTLCAYYLCDPVCVICVTSCGIIYVTLYVMFADMSKSGNLRTVFSVLFEVVVCPYSWIYVVPLGCFRFVTYVFGDIVFVIDQVIYIWDLPTYYGPCSYQDDVWSIEDWNRVQCVNIFFILQNGPWKKAQLKSYPGYTYFLMFWLLVRVVD